MTPSRSEGLGSGVPQDRDAPAPPLPPAGQEGREERSTLGDHRPAAVVCRERGWTAGTRLVGDEGYGPTTIEITAVGEDGILAKTITHATGEPCEHRDSESSWVLWCRDWTPALDEGNTP